MKLGLLENYPMLPLSEGDICLVCLNIGYKSGHEADYYVHHKCAEDEIKVLSNNFRDKTMKLNDDIANKIIDKYCFHFESVEFARHLSFKKQ